MGGGECRGTAPVDHHAAGLCAAQELGTLQRRWRRQRRDERPRVHSDDAVEVWRLDGQAGDQLIGERTHVDVAQQGGVGTLVADGAGGLGADTCAAAQ